jgi:hypothetical protein
VSRRAGRWNSSSGSSLVPSSEACAPPQAALLDQRSREMRSRRDDRRPVAVREQAAPALTAVRSPWWCRPPPRAMTTCARPHAQLQTRLVTLRCGRERAWQRCAASAEQSPTRRSRSADDQPGATHQCRSARLRAMTLSATAALMPSLRPTATAPPPAPARCSSRSAPPTSTTAAHTTQPARAADHRAVTGLAPAGGWARPLRAHPPPWSARVAGRRSLSPRAIRLRPCHAPRRRSDLAPGRPGPAPRGWSRRSRRTPGRSLSRAGIRGRA